MAMYVACSNHWKCQAQCQTLPVVNAPLEKTDRDQTNDIRMDNPLFPESPDGSTVELL